MATDRQTIRVTADTSDLKGLFRAISAMDKEAQNGIKDDVMAISRWVATDIQSAAASGLYPRQAALVAQTVRPTRDRLPTVTIGGSKRAAVTRRATATSPAPTVGELLFGNEFGSDRNTKGSKGNFPNGGFKFPERSPSEGRGNSGWWIFPTVKRLQPRITAEWVDIIKGIEKLWSK